MLSMEHLCRSSHRAPARCQYSRWKIGFTLVELLVVIAILAVLAALIFPLLARVRAKGAEAVCRSNMRQLGMAFSMYVGDWDGTLPSPGGLWGERNYWDQGSGRGLDVYLKNRTGRGSVWVCPEVYYWESRWEPRSYTMNTFLRDPPDVTPYTEAIRIPDGIALEAVPQPGATVLLFEGVQNMSEDPDTGWGYVARCGDWSMVRGYYRQPVEGLLLADRPYHGTVNNYLMCDGHVRTMPPDLRQPEQPSRGADLWFVHKLH